MTRPPPEFWESVPQEWRRVVQTDLLVNVVALELIIKDMRADSLRSSATEYIEAAYWAARRARAS
jgi:hypothetical protein